LKIFDELCSALTRQGIHLLDWRKKQQLRAQVFNTIEEILDLLPPVYNTPVYQKKCELAYQHFYGQYPSAQKTYTKAGKLYFY
jgi:type I restriction enzyme R subunit